MSEEHVKIARMLEDADKVVALTGAGISVESGIPDFRSPGGLWTRYNPAVYATYESYLNDPGKFWEMAAELNPLLENAEPNPAHEALVDLERLGKCQAVITQNIDYLHQRAGSSDVMELHGTYHSGTCLTCGMAHDYDEMKESVALGRVASCKSCGGVVKPDVVLFGEPLSAHVLQRAIEFSAGCDLMLVIGTGLEIFPAASLPGHAHRGGAGLVFINATETAYDQLGDVIVRGKAGEEMPKIVEAYQRLLNVALG